MDDLINSYSAPEYWYDGNGCLSYDANKGVSLIDYDQLDNPVRVQFTSHSITEHVYTADGRRLKTIHRTSVQQSTPLGVGVSAPLPSSQTLSVDSVDYVGNFIYEDGELKRYMINDGYLKLNANNTFAYRYFIKDHLGNNRMVTDGSGNIQQNTNYYPYGGMTYISTNQGEQQFKYNGKEYDPMHGLNEYDYGARQYDPAIGKFTTMDPLCEKYYHISPYAYCGGNPVNAVDPDGRSIVVKQFDDCKYVVIDGELDGKRDIYIYNNQNTKEKLNIKMLTQYSFFYDSGAPVIGAIIDMKDKSGQSFLNDFINDTPDLLYYMPNATGFEHYDFKNKGLSEFFANIFPQKIAELHRYRGMEVSVDGNNVIASARDIGNLAAGYIAGTYNLSEYARFAFDVLETYQQLKEGNNVKWYTEGNATQMAQSLGYLIGLRTRTAKTIKK